MKELKFAILAATILLFSSSFVYAAPSNLYWHSYDYYSIEMSGSGNAFVVGTISLEALTSQQVSSISLEIPYRGITVYKLVENGRYAQTPCILCPAGFNCPPCGQTYQPSAFLNYTTQTLSDSTIININLAYPIQNDTDTTIYLIFSTKSIAEKTFQGFSFNFKTVEDPNALIRSLSANVVVPENMYLKGEPSFNIEYKPSDIATQALKGSAESVAGALQRYPTYGGQFTANNLQPGESFTISGLYGDNLVLLYAQEIGLVVLGLIVLAIVIKYYFAGKVRGMFTKREGEERISRRASQFSFGRAILVGFISSMLFIAVYYLLNVLFENNYYYGGMIDTVAFLLINAVFILISLFILPYYLYAHYSKTEGVFAALISLILSFLLLILLLPQYSPPIIYQALSGVKTYASAASGGATSGNATVLPQ